MEGGGAFSLFWVKHWNYCLECRQNQVWQINDEYLVPIMKPVDNNILKWLKRNKNISVCTRQKQNFFKCEAEYYKDNAQHEKECDPYQVVVQSWWLLDLVTLDSWVYMDGFLSSKYLRIAFKPCLRTADGGKIIEVHNTVPRCLSPHSLPRLAGSLVRDLFRLTSRTCKLDNSEILRNRKKSVK